jgi:hypothetical protein
MFVCTNNSVYSLAMASHNFTTWSHPTTQPVRCWACNERVADMPAGTPCPICGRQAGAVASMPVAAATREPLTHQHLIVCMGAGPVLAFLWVVMILVYESLPLELVRGTLEDLSLPIHIFMVIATWLAWLTTNVWARSLRSKLYPTPPQPTPRSVLWTCYPHARWLVCANVLTGVVCGLQLLATPIVYITWIFRNGMPLF